MLCQHFPNGKVWKELGSRSILAAVPLGSDGCAFPRHRWGLSAGRCSQAPARLQLYFLSHQQDFSAAVCGPVMDVDSCMNSLCKTRLFSFKDDAFQILL